MSVILSCHVTNYVGEYAEICNCASNCIRLHHQIDQAFLILLTYVEKYGKAWVRGIDVLKHICAAVLVVWHAHAKWQTIWCCYATHHTA